MPKKQETDNQGEGFNAEAFASKVKAAVMDKPWGSAVLVAVGTIKLEIVRVSDGDGLMLRLSGQKPGNALKLTTRQHVDDLIELIRMVLENESDLMRKIETIKGMLPEGRSNVKVVL
ncbi:MAG: hypothetical protein RXR51_08430 [Nitrososphaeria archaeon]